MKIQIIRNVSAILIGLMLIIWPDVALQYLVIAIGALFFVPALIAIIQYFTHPSAERPFFPISSVGSALLGFLLMVAPTFFVNIFMLLLGAVLTYLGLSMIISLVAAYRQSTFSWMFFLIPVLLTLVGIVVLVNPFGTASASFILLGAGILVYGATYLAYNFFFKRREKASPSVRKVTDIEDAEIVEVLPETSPQPSPEREGE
ncbi:MAG: DUF308 domain-containing protein [Bacteroidales bacterium]|nr:DUF308 domain-containing protein [Bacteroidales bacterium]